MAIKEVITDFTVSGSPTQMEGNLKSFLWVTVLATVLAPGECLHMQHAVAPISFTHASARASNQSEVNPAAETIKSIKDDWQFNMTELAEILGVTRPTVYSWLKGKTSPDIPQQKHLQILAAAATDWAGATAGSNWDFLLDYTGPRADQTTIRETLQSADVSVTVIRELIHERMKQYQEAYAEARAILGEPVVVQGNPIHESTRKLNKRWAENAQKLHRFRNSFS